FPSVPILSHALAAIVRGGPAASRRSDSPQLASDKPIINPPVAVALSWRNARRVSMSASLVERGRSMNRLANPRVRAAPADVARHGSGDIGVGRAWILREERRRGHDLSRLAVATLRHVELDPGALERMAAIAREPFDRGDVLAGDAADGRH